MSLRYDEISEILKLIDGSSCDEFVLETAELRLVVRRRGANGAVPPLEPMQSVPQSPAPSTEPAAWTAAKASAPQAHTASDGAHIVRSPMVGTFYRSPSPGEPPFVDVDSKIRKGDPIGIIEVMKLFTTLHAEFGGTVTEIGAENAQLVEYGQMLFVIAPD